MKDERDLLSHVSRTLRERHDGSEPADARTRERILASVRKQNKRRSWWLKGSIPGGMLLLGTTAWAQATHQWPAVWRTIGDILSLPISSEGNSEQELANARGGAAPSGKTRPSAASSPAQAAATAESPTSLVAADAGLANEAEGDVAIDVESDTGETSADQARDDTAVSAARVRRKKVLAGEPREHPPEPQPTPEIEPLEPPSEPEIAAFRAANDLDIKQRNLGAALAAYRLYVRDYPAGRFVPEARYNAAIILVKLGKRDEARRELTPFASGKYGAHRQARAAKLLEGLEQSSAPNTAPRP